MARPAPGTVGWFDLTVADAPKVRDFYAGVAGWTHEGCDMGGYEDFVMKAGRKAVGGVCHARGPNKNLPPQWLIYINVASLTKSLKAVKKLGGRVLAGPRDMGTGSMAVIQDPAGAVAALFEGR